MEALRLALLYVHLIGFALLLGGAVAQYLSGTIRMNAAMLWGAVIQLVTGIGLAAPLRGGGDDEPDPAKLAVKACHRIDDLCDGVLFPQAADRQYRAFLGRRRPDARQCGSRRVLALSLVILPTYQAYPLIVSPVRSPGHGRVTGG